MNFKNFLKYGLPLITVAIILVIGYVIFSSGNTATSSNTNQAASTQGCTIKYQPKTKNYLGVPQFCIDKNKTYTATIATSAGDIVMKLLPMNAPQTVNNFVFLAKSGFYDNLLFHRVIPDFVVQAGDPKGDGTGGPGYTFGDEINASSLGISQDEINTNQGEGYSYSTTVQTVKILSGTVAMANSGPNSNGSQFFIALTDQPTLDGKYTPFGEVTSGMDVANKIAGVNRDSNDKPLSPITIKTITISEQ